MGCKVVAGPGRGQGALGVRPGVVGPRPLGDQNYIFFPGIGKNPLLGGWESKIIFKKYCFFGFFGGFLGVFGQRTKKPWLLTMVI